MTRGVLTVSESLFLPVVMKEMPWVSKATPVLCTCSSTYLYNTYEQEHTHLREQKGVCSCMCVCGVGAWSPVSALLVWLYIPVDERALSCRVVPHHHNDHLTSWGEEGHTHLKPQLDEACNRIGGRRGRCGERVCHYRPAVEMRERRQRMKIQSQPFQLSLIDR